MTCTRGPEEAPVRPGEIPAPRPQAYLTNTGRLMHRTGLRPPAEADAQYWASQA
jgi:hypothetical protein